MTLIFQYFAFATAIAYACVPMIFIYQLRHGVLKEERLSILSIAALYLDGLFYFILSFVKFRKEPEIDVADFCNLFGAYLGLIYIILYYKYFYYETRQKLFFLILTIVIISSIGLGFLEFFIAFNNYNSFCYKLLEWIGVLFNIFEYFPMGFDIIYLIKNKISEKFTIFGASCGLINSIFWLIWSILESKNEENGDHDKYHSLVANILGIILCLIQFFILLIFRKEEEEEEKEDDENKDEKEDDENAYKKLEDNIKIEEIQNSETDVNNRDKTKSVSTIENYM
jgi:hypothetical protein